MRRSILILAAFSLATPAAAQVHVRGYTRSDGTYVAPYTRTAPDRSIYNNYSTQPNINPYTGQQGTVNTYAPSQLYGSQSRSSGYSSPPPCYSYPCPR